MQLISKTVHWTIDICKYRFSCDNGKYFIYFNDISCKIKITQQLKKQSDTPNITHEN